MATAGYLKIGQLLGGRLVISTGTTPARVGEQPFLFPQQPYAGTTEEFELSSVVLEASIVEEHARQLLGDDDFRLRFTGFTPASEAAARHWSSTAAHLRENVLPHQEVINLPLIRAEAFRGAAAAVLRCFPSTFQDYTPDGGLEKSAVPTPVRRAVAFIDSNLQHDIGVVEIARAARISPYGLVVAFRRQVGTTPAAYLQAARLDAARTELLAADPSTGVTVEAVAARWGFGDPHRFSAQYRIQHGETPTAALHR